MKTNETQQSALFTDVKRAVFFTALYFGLRIALSGLFSHSLAETAAIAVVFLVYLVSIRSSGLSWLLRGLIVSLAAGVLFGGSVMLSSVGLVLLALLILSILRSVVRPSTACVFGCDFALTVLSFSIATLVNVRCGGVLAIWTFFLLQGFAGMLPKKGEAKRSHSIRDSEEENFARALGSAEMALRRVIANTGD